MGPLLKPIVTGLALLLVTFHLIRQLWGTGSGATSWNARYSSSSLNETEDLAPSVNAEQATNLDDVAKAPPPYAFVSLLTMDNDTVDLANPAVYSELPNFISARVLAYQFVHAPKTRSRKGYPLIIAVGPEVPQAAREQLQRDGAQVVEVEHLGAEWLRPEDKRFQNVMTKLRIASWTQFKLVCLFDLDTTLTQNMDGIFAEPELTVRENRHLEAGGKIETDDGVEDNNLEVQASEVVKADEGAQPEQYMIAGMATIGCGHPFPPHESDKYKGHWINAGLIMWRPSMTLYKHYLAVLAQPDRFDSGWPEEGLLNYVHREDGNMPWADLNYIWDAPCSGGNDLRAGVRALHRKWWDDTKDDAISYAMDMRWQMETFYEDRYKNEDRQDVKYRFRHQ